MWRRVFGTAGHLENTRMSKILTFLARLNADLRFTLILETV